MATTTTASNGTYSFGNLSQGVYFVQEVVPTGWVQTGGPAAGYYTVAVVGGTMATGDNFDDYQLCNCAQNVSNFSYTDVASNGTVTHPTSLSGNVHEGDTLTATFTTAVANSTLTLVSYTAPNGSFTRANLPGAGSSTTSTP